MPIRKTGRTAFGSGGGDEGRSRAGEASGHCEEVGWAVSSESGLVDLKLARGSLLKSSDERGCCVCGGGSGEDSDGGRIR